MVQASRRSARQKLTHANRAWRSSHRPIAGLTGLIGKTGAGSTRSRCSSWLRKTSQPTRRTYLTGHSMGGHGTWHLGVTFPDRFAAIAPGRGWISMWSYAGAKRPAAAPMKSGGAGRFPQRYAGTGEKPHPLGVYIFTAMPTITSRSARPGGCGRLWVSFTLILPITSSREPVTGGACRCRLAAAICLPERTQDSRFLGSASHRFRHGQPGSLASRILGIDRSPAKSADDECRASRVRRQEPAVWGGRRQTSRG